MKSSKDRVKLLPAPASPHAGAVLVDVAPQVSPRPPVPSEHHEKISLLSAHAQEQQELCPMPKSHQSMDDIHAELPHPETSPRKLLSSESTKGYCLMASASLSFALMTLFVHILGSAPTSLHKSGYPIPSFEIVFARSGIQLIFAALACLLVFRVSPLGDRSQSLRVRLLVLTRGLTGALALACLFHSLTVLSLAESTVIFYTCPAFTAIFARVALKEPFGVADGLSVLACFVGVFLVAQPWQAQDTTISGVTPLERFVAVGSNILAAILGAVGYTLVRHIGPRAHFMQHVFFFGCVSSALSLVGMFTLQTPVLPHSPVQWGELVATGLFASIAQSMLNRGFQLVPAGPGALMNNLEVVFAFLLGVFVLGEIPTLASGIGAAIIISATILTAIRKW
eukprot:CAMPEP_0184333840 /NCGR_PEP_ID=MMETSP1089-20130417/2797_1 /TAXON_ID=38269 ORGANISM="Gloeochaete wittrockiana, Strain SAG46.84" /NCGR_SAMPLE_ID=MMETSP1089 /ASSEMBLY_ACC=CAM_ASM_000445 /LENGTH=395 /DNA_ID=CAMNT_0026657893 /DNA_START=100 /DNA_END=1284 /DNA_ORIENTATION=+